MKLPICALLVTLALPAAGQQWAYSSPQCEISPRQPCNAEIWRQANIEFAALSTLQNHYWAVPKFAILCPTAEAVMRFADARARSQWAGVIEIGDCTYAPRAMPARPVSRAYLFATHVMLPGPLNHDTAAGRQNYWVLNGEIVDITRIALSDFVD